MIEVVAAIIKSGDQVLLAKRKDEKSQAGYWEFPGGKIENGETEEEALIRELKEEFEIDIEINSKFHENIHQYASNAVLLKSFIVTHIKGKFKLNDHEEIVWSEIDDVLNYNLAPADIAIATKLSQLSNIKRSYYSRSIRDFLNDSENEILGSLLSNHTNRSLEELQRNAWREQIQILKNQLYDFDGYIFFEFAIPRMGKRVDNVIVTSDTIFIIEFKVGEHMYKSHDIEQVIDYTLDLKNFHEGSHNLQLMPVIVATNAQESPNSNVIKCNKTNIGSKLSTYFNQNGVSINPRGWANSIYKPTPTIIEAAQALYKGHNVKEISRSDAGAHNLTKTAFCLNTIIDQAKNSKEKVICFVTGVPGSGKTLAGLNIANQRMKTDEGENAVFLSGNGPLVDVLREALARDLVLTHKHKSTKINKKDAKRQTHSFIQNIHHFRDEYLNDLSAPIEKVVVFDEAQRAWNKKQTGSFMKRKKGRLDFDMSEPEYLIDVMDRNKEWCAIVCLIGGGQEINTGEAGLEEWINALESKFKEWNIHYSDQIIENTNYLNDPDTKKWLSLNGLPHAELHLSISIRSFRTEKLSEFVRSLLDLELENCKEIYRIIQEVYPIFLTRDLLTAKNWLREKLKVLKESVF